MYVTYYIFYSHFAVLIMFNVLICLLFSSFPFVVQRPSRSLCLHVQRCLGFELWVAIDLPLANGPRNACTSLEIYLSSIQ